jgi:cytidylate kinase
MPGKTIEKLIDEHVRKWEIMRAEKKGEKKEFSAITISREPGSGGRIVAGRIADRLNLDLFHQEILHEMAKNSKVGERLLETLDEKALTVLQDWISTLVNREHLWPDQYMKHLMNVVLTIGKHGGVVIVGRGANFILPSEGRFRVRIVAPLETRVQNVARDFNVGIDEARRRVLRTESDRRAFVRKYFHADITDPINYDLVINTGSIDVDGAVDSISAVLRRR